MEGPGGNEGGSAAPLAPGIEESAEVEDGNAGSLEKIDEKVHEKENEGAASAADDGTEDDGKSVMQNWT